MFCPDGATHIKSPLEIADVWQQFVERAGTLYFSFQDLDSTKPAGSVKIRIETIAHYLHKHCGDIVAKKRAAAPPSCPLLDH